MISYSASTTLKLANTCLISPIISAGRAYILKYLWYLVLSRSRETPVKVSIRSGTGTDVQKSSDTVSSVKVNFMLPPSIKNQYISRYKNCQIIFTVAVNNQFEAQLFMYIYFYSLYVSGSHVTIIRRITVSMRHLVYVTLCR